MPFKHFIPEADTDDLLPMFGELTKLVGWSTWKRRIDSLRIELKTNPFWDTYLTERYGLEMAFGDVHKYFRSTNRLPWPPRTVEEFRLYGFMATFTRVHALLTSGGQRKIIGALTNCLEKDFGLGPLAFEMTVISHCLSRNFGIMFSDLDGNGGHDFLIVNESLEIEVECKHVSGDIGRQIPLRSFFELGGTLSPEISRAVDVGNEGRLIQVTLPERLSSNKAVQARLADQITAVLTGRSEPIDSTICTITERNFSLIGSPFSTGSRTDVTMKEVRSYLSREHNIENRHVIVNWKPDRAAVVVEVQSIHDDKVLERIFRNLADDAKKQFSHKRPAILCVHLAAVTEEQLIELADAEKSGVQTGLQRMISHLLHKRPHLHTVAVTTGGHIVQSTGEGAKTSFRENGPSYVFRNPDHPDANNPSVMNLF